MTDAYWSSINWTSIAALITAIAAISAPFFNGWWNNRIAATSTKAKRAETEIERLEKREAEQYRRTEERAARAEAVAKELEEECERIRNQALGMEEWAHWYRHDLINLHRMFVIVVENAERFMDGTASREQMMEMLRRARLSMPVEPRSVPLLRETDELRP